MQGSADVEGSGVEVEIGPAQAEQFPAPQSGAQGFSRVGPGSDIEAIITGLSPSEKRLVLTDRSPDGWSYSTQFAQFGFLSEATVARALPDGPEFAAAVAAFLAGYRAERARVETRYPTGVMAPM